MILRIDRGHIAISIRNKEALIPGEMFFPGGDKLGFVVYRDLVEFWEPKSAGVRVTKAELSEILDDIRAEFLKGKHILEIG